MLTDTGTPAELLARASLFKQLLESFEPEAGRNAGSPPGRSARDR